MMYKENESQIKISLFPEMLIDKKSIWFSFSKIIDWEFIESEFANLFSDKGRKAIPIRQIVGALIIQAYKNLSDRETITVIRETPMLQYFLGLPTFSCEDIFDFTLLCKYRKLLGIDKIKIINDNLLKDKTEQFTKACNETHKGEISIDATVTPVNITYPTDLKLLNKTREKLERIIDENHVASASVQKPRTYRENARKDYLTYAKKKMLSKKLVREANRKQLGYVGRNIRTIETLVSQGIYELTESQNYILEVSKEIYEQQKYMWDNKVNRVEDRIVSFEQSHVRGIVRGKAGKRIEFGAKLAVSKINGFIHIDKISFDNFNEKGTLKDIVEKYYTTYGFYPEAVLADKIYQTRENKKWCNDLGIRLSGPKLGRKKANDDDEQKIMKEDFKKRQEIEGVFGVAKQRYGLSKLMTKLPDGQKVSIGLIFFVMNMKQLVSYSHFSNAFEILIIGIETNYEELIWEEEPKDSVTFV